MRIGNRLSNLGALSARSTFGSSTRGGGNALTPGYLLPRLRRWLSEVLLFVTGQT